MYPRWLWPFSALPGVIWLLMLFLLPFYAVIAVAFGNVDPILLTRRPGLEPARLEPRLDEPRAGPASPRQRLCGTCGCARVEYVLMSLRCCVLIGYPVAYYVARHAAARRTCC